MTTNGEFGQLVRAIMTNTSESATPQVAVLHSGDGRDWETGLEVVYTQDLSEHRLPEFDDIPWFDLLIAEMPDPVGSGPDMVLRFLRVRRPAFVILTQRALGRAFYQEARRLGYEVNNTRNGVVLGTLEPMERGGLGALARKVAGRLRGK